MADKTIPIIERVRKRADFVAAARAPSCARGAVVVQALPRPDADGVRAGFTATRKIGGAVQRNRAKRRLRAAARLLLPLHGAPGADYIFIARGGTTARPWSRLLDDVKSALISLAPKDSAPAKGGAEPASPPSADMPSADTSSKPPPPPPSD